MDPDGTLRRERVDPDEWESVLARRAEARRRWSVRRARHVEVLSRAKETLWTAQTQLERSEETLRRCQASLDRVRRQAP